MIGNKDYFGKGLGVKTLEAFIEYLRENYDPQADTFFIDPAVNNQKALHVYKKAGFTYINDFLREGNGAFPCLEHHFFVKQLPIVESIYQR